MKYTKRIMVTIVAIALLSGNIIFLYRVGDNNVVQIYLAVISIIVTIILGATTYFQTQNQIILDRLDKTPFYELCFPEIDKDNYAHIYQRNCILVRKVGSKCFIDFEFENKTSNVVSSVKIKTTESLNSAGEKLKQINQQEKNIGVYSNFLENVSKEELGDGLIIFEKWLEYDTGTNSNYDKRVRELILHFFYYYETDFNQDLTPYRDDKTNNKERTKIIKKIIEKGSNQSISFYEYFCNEKNSLIYQLQDNIIKWVENEEELNRLNKFEKMNINTNLIVNNNRFHHYIPFNELMGNKEMVQLSIELLITSAYNYQYQQIIEMCIVNKEKINMGNIPDEMDIYKKMQELSRYEEKKYKNHYRHEKEEIDKIKKSRARVYISDFKMSIKPIKRTLCL